MTAGTKVTQLEATDPDDAELVFNVSVLSSSVSLLRVVNDGLKTASVFLNAPLNAVVRHSLTYLLVMTSLSQLSVDVGRVSASPTIRGLLLSTFS